MENKKNLSGEPGRDRLSEDDAVRTGARVPDGDENYDDEELDNELDEDEEDDDELLEDDDDDEEDAEEKDVI